MTRKYEVLELGDYSRRIGEDNVRLVLGTFNCPLNNEVQDFLMHKAVQAEKLKSAITYLVFDAEASSLAGYFTLVLKAFSIAKDKLSSNNRKLISRFAELNERTGEYTTALYLIAQLGKNFTIVGPKRISGRELVELALDTLRKAQRVVGGKLVLVEREADRPKLLDFYNACGFKSWNERYDKGDAVRYDQMIRVLESVM
ncbi:MAG: GNAT family acetyltransferase [Kiritimatiellae bacterium]|nr:GNAT family acetyltransferase [Kiritimatiellia bacterium]MBP5228158.1 GNAT family acetyltransferase [Kiritimatiellia bacterium]